MLWLNSFIFAIKTLPNAINASEMRSGSLRCYPQAVRGTLTLSEKDNI